jgi:hypothetical protein
LGVYEVDPVLSVKLDRLAGLCVYENNFGLRGSFDRFSGFGVYECNPALLVSLNLLADRTLLSGDLVRGILGIERDVVLQLARRLFVCRVPLSRNVLARTAGPVLCVLLLDGAVALSGVSVCARLGLLRREALALQYLDANAALLRGPVEARQLLL